MEENIECAGFTFYNNFDSANLAKVENVEINKAENGKNENNKSHKNSTLEVPSREFNLWTKQDCHGTEFQNNNRTWFHFGIKAAAPGVYVKLNLVNLNKQVKMFSQGMCPVFKVIPGHPQWDRIKEKPTFMADDKNNEFMLSFNYRASENPNAITYFAFTYPFSYTDLQNYLKKIDAKMSKQNTHLADDIYYHRECAIKSLEGRRLDILTISSYYNKSLEREAKIKDLFPEENEERPFKFYDKKIIFLSARVHPGETPSSFVLNGFINLLLNRDDQIAIVLRRLYVFKLIPMLNPDGVAQGYYRMDTRGINLNRLYLNPSKTEHPTIFAAKQLLRYYHNWYSLPEDLVPDVPGTNSIGTSTFDLTSNINSISNETNKLLQRVTLMSLEEKNKRIEQGSRVRNYLVQASEKSIEKNQGFMDYQPKSIDSEEDIPCRKVSSASSIKQYSRIAEDSGIFLYVDFHGHASKKGIFMYGNHFDDPEDASACMLLPKLMSINNSNFHFTSCNFAEKNMYLIDKRDGMSREGSGRVAVYKLFGLVHSYTLECNYNTGRLVNSVPARLKENIHKLHGQIFVPPKYNPTVFEEVGAAFGPSILDMSGNNPNSRLPNSQYRSLKGLKSYLKLISTNHYQTTLNKPLHKTDRYSQDSSSSEILDKPTARNSGDSSSTSCRKYFRATAGFVKAKVKRNHQVKQLPKTTTRSVPKFSTAKSKLNNHQSKIKKIGNPKVFPKCQLPTKMKMPVKNSIKKSTIFAKRITIKKHQGAKTNSKVRHKIHIELQQTSKKSNTKFVNDNSKNKPKNKANYFVKSKKNNVKVEHKKAKKSSISKS